MAQPTAKKSKPAAADADGPVFYPPLKPNRKLLVTSAVVLAAWVATLLVIYFTSIKPMRQPAVKVPSPDSTPAGPTTGPTTRG